uniref:Protein transport protein sec16 n=1 Tax=Anser cygnoides TaxID=8845 RepID=A0A8B9DF98_ANSCY
MGHLPGGLSSTRVPRLVPAPGSRATPPAGTRAARHPGQRATRAATPSGPTPGKDMKTPTGSTQRPPTGTTTLTKATSGSLWPGRVTETRDTANPTARAAPTGTSTTTGATTPTWPPAHPGRTGPRATTCTRRAPGGRGQGGRPVASPESPACSCSTASRGSAPAATSSASTSATEPTTATLRFRRAGAQRREVILHGTKEQEELQAFPGPLAREDLHKVDVMTFCQQKIATSCDLSTQRGRDSALLWKLLVLLCRQNGSMVGSDVAELLMQDRRHQEKYKRQNPMENPTSLAEDEWRQPGTLDLITGEVPPVVETQAQIVEKFTKLLYYGRKKDALLWAMRNQLWGHALFLSSKMDPRTYSWVLTGFTSTLATNDPLQTLFQLMSGRIPQVAQSCGDAKWGDWRPHLAVLLSNKVGDMELNHRAIITMGDSLAGRGAVEAAHFCYLMADIPFGYFGAKADRMALLGSSHRQAFAQFASTEAIQRMEIFEYCQQLRQPKSFLLPFQVYKLLYASRLADHGLPAQALNYCEHIATVLLGQDPASHPVLAQQLVKLAERLKLCDPLLLEMPEQDQALEPEWLLQLRAHCQHWETEDDLTPEVAPTQPELSWAAASTPGGEPNHELPPNDGYQQELWHQPVPPVPPQGPSPHQDVSIQPLAPAEVAALGMGPATSPGGLSSEPSPQVVPPAGDAGEPQDAHEVQQHPSLPAEPGLSTRARSVSESSTISQEEGSQLSSDSAPEEPAAEVTPGEDKSSGFRWFGWFRSKPTTEATSKATSAADCPTPEPQERMSPSPPDSAPAAGMSPSASPLPTSRNPVSIDMKGPWAMDSHKAGDQPGSNQPPLGTIPLFNPAEISQLTTARPSQPRLLSQRRYPNPL